MNFIIYLEYCIYSIDSLNLAFLYLIFSLISFIDWIGGFEVCNSLFSLFIMLLFILFLLAFIFSSIIFFFISFESLVMLVFLLSLLFCGSYYKIRTSFYLYMVSIVGCLCFYVYITLFIIFSLISFLLGLCLFIPFFIKIPSFPFYYWLPEVHCEVNTSISLFLAGLLLNLGVYGILCFIYNSLYYFVCVCMSMVYVVSICGVFIILGCLIRCMDIKKIIAYSSILHLSWGLCILVCMSMYGWISGLINSIAHGFTSCGLFLLGGLVITSSYCSYMDVLYYVDYVYLVLLVVCVLCNLSFPGTMNFLSELLGVLCLLGMDGCVYGYFMSYIFLFYVYYVVCMSSVIPIITGWIMWGLWLVGVVCVGCVVCVGGVSVVC